MKLLNDDTHWKECVKYNQKQKQMMQDIQSEI